MTSKLDAALSLARRGFYVFRLKEDEKLPLEGVPWRKVSTRNPDTIKRWWSCDALGWAQEYNIGIDTGKSGLYVVDVDVKKDAGGEESFAELDMIYGFDKTLEASTPSGGRHLYYQGEGLANTASSLGKGIDTRGDGGFVVAPGSIVGGKPYTWTKDALASPLPDWVGEQLKKYRIDLNDRAHKGEIFSLDAESDIKRAVKYLENDADTAVEGASGDHTTFAVAARLKDFGLSAETALLLMLEHWNPLCSPPWDDDELERKVENAYRYGANPIGASSAQAEFDSVDEEDQAEGSPLLTPVRRFEISDIPPREWIFGNMLIAKKVSALIAPGGAGKSTLTMEIAVSKATGRNILGIPPRGAGAVAIWNNEDDMEEMERRLGAIMQHFDLEHDDLLNEDAEPMLYMNSGEHKKLMIARKTGLNGTIKAVDKDEIVAALVKANIKLWIVDPFAETHPANENDNGEVLAVAGIYRSIAQEVGCGLLIVHHDRKPDSGSADGHIGNMHSSRGASSLSGAVRAMFTLHTMPEKDLKKYNIPEEDRHKYVRLDGAKANMSLNTGEPMWFVRQSERLNMEEGDPDSGESVGVLVPTKLTVKRDVSEDAHRSLLLDIESLVDGAGDQGLAVREVANSLIRDFPMHKGKDSNNLDRAIRRLFANGSLAGAGGTLYLVDLPKQKGETARKARTVIRWAAKIED